MSDFPDLINLAVGKRHKCFSKKLVQKDKTTSALDGERPMY